jgi:hypothetical protein
MASGLTPFALANNKLIEVMNMEKKCIQSEWSLTEVVAALEENMLFNMTYYAKHIPSIQLVPMPNVTVVRASIPDDTYNLVMNAQFTKENANDRVKEVLQLFKNPDIPFCWWTAQSNTPSNLEEILNSHGLFNKAEDIGMYLPMEEYEEGPVDPSVQIQRVETTQQLQDFSEIIVSIGSSPNSFELIYSKLPLANLQKETKFHIYVGYLNEKPVVSGILALHANVGGIYYIATNPEQRKKGFGTVMMDHILKVIKQQGYHMAILQASKDGLNMYQRLGFIPCCTFKEFGY